VLEIGGPLKYNAVLMIAVVPKTKTPFWENMARSGIGSPVVVHYKTGFSKMRLLCGEKEVEPIWPGHVTEGTRRDSYAVLVDESSGGRYLYPHDAVSPQCGKVILQLFSTKDPNRATEKVLEPARVQRIWQDFDAYRQKLTKGTETAER
jgi:hypothetical protein